jgi:hypothetical protein
MAMVGELVMLTKYAAQVTGGDEDELYKVERVDDKGNIYLEDFSRFPLLSGDLYETGQVEEPVELVEEEASEYYDPLDWFTVLVDSRMSEIEDEMENKASSTFRLKELKDYHHEYGEIMESLETLTQTVAEFGDIYSVSEIIDRGMIV